MYKICSRCQKSKLIHNFSIDNRAKSGISCRCKDCDHYYSQINKTHIQQYKKRYYKLNKEKLKQEHKQYYTENKVRLLIRSKEYQQTHRDQINETKKQYRKRHNKNIKDNANQYLKFRRNTDIEFKLRESLRCRFYQAIRGNYKKGSAIKDLGCTVDYLKKYLESKFYPNPETGELMTWKNYGKLGWHIDHIIPLSSFNLTDIKESQKAVHYTNLQPLWYKENLSKGSKLN